MGVGMVGWTPGEVGAIAYPIPNRSPASRSQAAEPAAATTWTYVPCIEGYPWLSPLRGRAVPAGSPASIQTEVLHPPRRRGLRRSVTARSATRADGPAGKPLVCWPVDAGPTIRHR